jgi:ribonuclease P protein component
MRSTPLERVKMNSRCQFKAQFKARLTLGASLLSSGAPDGECGSSRHYPGDRLLSGLQIYEATVSTIENPPQTAAWVPEPQFQQERARRFAQSPPRWPQASHPGLKAVAQGNRLRFGRAARLKTGRDFGHIRKEGQRLVMGCIIANWVRLPESGSSRLGVVTAGRIGNAVVRSRARRLLREAFRIHQHEFTQPLDLVLVARPSIAGKAFASVEKDFLTTLRKAGLLKING